MGTAAGDGTAGNISAADAMAYAASGDMLALYGVLVAGWALRTFGASIAAASSRAVPRWIQFIVGWPLVLVGTILAMLGIVALAYKVFVDAFSA